jgi:hypothetical protein
MVRNLIIKSYSLGVVSYSLAEMDIPHPKIESGSYSITIH